MRVSINITDYSWPGELGSALERIARIADEGGLDTVWVSDHLIQTAPGSVPNSEMLEAHSALGFLAARTENVRLGTMVAAVSFRPPALLVKSITTLDVLSGGRAWLGIGAGYQEDEARAMGLPLPPVAERFERLDETLQIAHRMWSGDRSAFHGRHYALEQPVECPLPVTRPRPPILIGGAGERKTLRLVARYGDACNVFDIPDGGATVRHKLDVLTRHCEELGRPIGEIDKTISTRLEPGESADAFAERCGELAALGLDHAVVITSGPWTEDGVATLAAAASAVKDL